MRTRCAPLVIRMQEEDVLEEIKAQAQAQDNEPGTNQGRIVKNIQAIIADVPVTGPIDSRMDTAVVSRPIEVDPDDAYEATEPGTTRKASSQAGIALVRHVPGGAGDNDRGGRRVTATAITPEVLESRALRRQSFTWPGGCDPAWTGPFTGVRFM